MKFLKNCFLFIAFCFAAVIGVLLLSILVLMLTLAMQGVGEGAGGTLAVKTDSAVAVVDVSGEIISSDKFRKSLDKVVDNEKIKAIVVRIESPGGSVGASEEIYRAIKEADQKKPVVCSLGNVAASGGLYAAVGCRKIVTNEGTLTGSIGVILMMPNFASVVERAGVQMNVVKSGKFKDTGSPFRAFGEDEKGLLQNLVNTSYEQFVKVISESRSLEVEKVKEFADGRIILGEQAVEFGIADEIGGLSKAAKIALKLHDPETEDEPELIFPKKPSGLFSVFSDLQESRIFHWLRSYGQLRLLYQAYL